MVLTRSAFVGEITAVLGGHRTLHALEQGRDGVDLRTEHLGHVDDVHAMQPAVILMVRSGVGVLEAPPPANVIHQHGGKLLGLRDVMQQFQKRRPILQVDSAPALIFIARHDFHFTRSGVRRDRILLKRWREVLLVCGHPDVLRGEV